MRRAGLVYSWALSLLLIVSPLVVGIVRPLAMPAMNVAMIVGLWFFDRPPRSLQVPNIKLD